MDKSRVLTDLGKICETLLESDLKSKVQLRLSAVLDHEIDGELLEKAWEKTKRVYPLIDAQLGYDHDEDGVLDLEKARKYGNDHLYLLKPDNGVSRPVRSRVPLRPYTEAAGWRIICVSFCGKKVSLSSLHILADGSGIKMIFATLLYVYLSLYTGHEDAQPVVTLEEGRKPEEYYKADLLAHVFAMDYQPVPLYSLPRGCKGFFDEDMYNDENVYSGSLRLKADDLLRVCKETGANPSALLCALSAKAAYRLNPDKREDIVLSLTVSLKQNLGLDNCISNAVRNALAYTTYEDIMQRPLSESVQKIRRDVNMQRTKDYMITLCRFFDTYCFVPTVRPRLVSYLGEFTIGSMTGHITHVEAESTGHYVVYMLQLGGDFLFTVQYGRATERYLKEFQRLFTEAGIDNAILCPAHAISPGTAETDKTCGMEE